MKYLLKIICVTLLCCVGCSPSLRTEELPLWIENPASFVKKDDIFAIGNGATLNQAQQMARSEILKYFETNISSSFVGDITATEEISSKQINEEVKEQTSGLLQGVSIVRSSKTKDGYYVLAVLDKTKSQKILKHEISLIDTRLKGLLNESPVNTSLFTKYYQEREGLNKKYMLLGGSEISLDIPRELIPSSHVISRDSMTKRANIGKIAVSTLPFNIDLQNALESHLSALGYILNARGKAVIVELKNETCEEISKIWSCEQTVQVTFKKRIIPYTAKGIGKTKEGAHKELQKQLLLKFPKDL